jgi:hypothetical protein
MLDTATIDASPDLRPGAPPDAPVDAPVETPVEATPTRPAPAKPARDGRIDALRGLALLMMFADHIPQNLLNRFTMRNIGFADAAEIFVLLAGFASMLAYGRVLQMAGWREGINRIARRIGKLYLFQFSLVVISIVLIRAYSHVHPTSPDYLEPELAHGVRNIWRALFLFALPANLNILPLYIVLLATFPLIWGRMRRGLAVALVPSALLWLAVNLDPDINVPNWLDPDGWYFNPFAWQFLFAVGAGLAVVSGRFGGDLPRLRPLVVASWTYLALSALEAFPYTQYGLPNLAPFALQPSKTVLSPLRLLDVLAIFYLVASSPLARRAAGSPPGRFLALLGRHSLEVFTLSTFIDLLAKLAFDTLGQGWPMQILVNGGGVTALWALARVLDRRKQAARVRRTEPARA